MKQKQGLAFLLKHLPRFSPQTPLLLLDIYPAREQPIPGVTSAMIAGLMQNPNVNLTTKSQLLNLLRTKQIDVLMTMGAGDIDTLIEPIKTLLTTNAKL